MGYVEKSQSAQGTSAFDLEQINRYTRRPFSDDEVYTFSVVLCDNEVDRDFERFSIASLQKLAELFLGRTGISDHSMRSSDQMARIYCTKVEKVEGKTTSCGEPYTRLTAKAYLPRTEKNRDLITEIEAGMKKEVSVGCAVSRMTCSVCGKPWHQEGCSHEKGKLYAGEACHVVLDEPEDAYEWSFVAVPAQREAGVIKAFRPEKGGDFTEILKKLDHPGEGFAVSAEEAAELKTYLGTLEKDAACGREYRKRLCAEVVRLAMVAQPGLSREVMARTAEAMPLDDLLAFEKAFRNAAAKTFPAQPQLTPTRATSDVANQAFKI